MLDYLGKRKKPGSQGLRILLEGHSLSVNLLLGAVIVGLKSVKVHRRVLLTTAYLAGLVATAAISAQRSPQEILAAAGIPSVKPMSDQALRATKGRIAAELSRAAADSFFIDISDENGGKVRHTTSGLVCPVGKERQHVLSATLDSAVCETANEDSVYRTSVTRASQGGTSKSAAAAVIAEVEKERGYRRLNNIIPSIQASPSSSASDHATLRFISKTGDREMFNTVFVAVIRGWTLVERIQSPIESAESQAIRDSIIEATFGIQMK